VSKMILLATFMLLQWGDGVSTYLCIKSGKGNEANKIVAWGISKIGLVPALIIYKSFAISVAILLIDYSICLILLNLLYGYVVFNNYKIWKS
jgi:hypothetical protein